MIVSYIMDPAYEWNDFIAWMREVMEADECCLFPEGEWHEFKGEKYQSSVQIRQTRENYKDTEFLN